MLTTIRNMLRSKLAGLLFILIIVAMGAWGVTDVVAVALALVTGPSLALVLSSDAWSVEVS